MKKIAIIGGGISGLYFANLLQLNNKFEYKIFEKKSKLELNNGYGIQLSVNSIKLLNQIGFEKIKAHEIFFPRRKASDVGSLGPPELSGKIIYCGQFGSA